MRAYGKLCTEFYDLDKPAAPPDELAFYLAQARIAGGPVLEPMCGSGRFLIPIMEAGLDIEGTDLSPDMLEACRANAAARGLKPVLHEQSLETLAVSRTFSFAFICSGSFGLIPTEAGVRASLARLHGALKPGARLMLEVERLLPASGHGEAWTGDWGGREVARADGGTIRINWHPRWDPASGTVISTHRYDASKDGVLLASETEEFIIRPHDPKVLTAQLAGAGFERVEFLKPHGSRPAQETDSDLVVSCVRR